MEFQKSVFAAEIGIKSALNRSSFETDTRAVENLITRAADKTGAIIAKMSKETVDSFTSDLTRLGKGMTRKTALDEKMFAKLRADLKDVAGASEKSFQKFDIPDEAIEKLKTLADNLSPKNLKTSGDILKDIAASYDLMSIAGDAVASSLERQVKFEKELKREQSKSGFQRGVEGWKEGLEERKQTGLLGRIGAGKDLFHTAINVVKESATDTGFLSVMKETAKAQDALNDLKLTTRTTSDEFDTALGGSMVRAANAAYVSVAELSPITLKLAESGGELGKTFGSTGKTLEQTSAEVKNMGRVLGLTDDQAVELFLTLQRTGNVKDFSKATAQILQLERTTVNSRQDIISLEKSFLPFIKTLPEGIKSGMIASIASLNDEMIRLGESTEDTIKMSHDLLDPRSKTGQMKLAFAMMNSKNPAETLRQWMLGNTGYVGKEFISSEKIVGKQFQQMGGGAGTAGGEFLKRNMASIMGERTGEGIDKVLAEMGPEQPGRKSSNKQPAETAEKLIIESMDSFNRQVAAGQAALKNGLVMLGSQGIGEATKLATVATNTLRTGVDNLSTHVDLNRYALIALTGATGILTLATLGVGKWLSLGKLGGGVPNVSFEGAAAEGLATRVASKLGFESAGSLLKAVTTLSIAGAVTIMAAEVFFNWLNKSDEQQTHSIGTQKNLKADEVSEFIHKQGYKGKAAEEARAYFQDKSLIEGEGIVGTFGTTWDRLTGKISPDFHKKQVEALTKKDSSLGKSGDMEEAWNKFHTSYNSTPEALKAKPTLAPKVTAPEGLKTSQAEISPTATVTTRYSDQDLSKLTDDQRKVAGTEIAKDIQNTIHPESPGETARKAKEAELVGAQPPASAGEDQGAAGSTNQEDQTGSKEPLPIEDDKIVKAIGDSANLIVGAITGLGSGYTPPSQATTRVARGAGASGTW